MAARIIIAGALSLLATAVAAQPAPDCRQAKTPTETAICGNAELAAADKAMAQVYAAFRATLPRDQQQALLVDQRQWLTRRTAACGDKSDDAFVRCLLTETEARRRFLAGGSPNGAAGAPRLLPHFFHEARKRYEITIAYPQIPNASGPAAGFNKAMRAAAFGKNVVTEYRSLDPPMVAGVANFYEASYRVAYLDRRLASVVFEIATYTGGAHPNSARLGILFDLEQGRPWPLTDILADPRTAIDPIAGACKSRLEAEARKEDWELFDNADVAAVVREVENWSADKDGVEILFDPYSVAPYAIGPRVCRLGYAELANWLKPGGPLPPHQEEKK